MRKLTSLTSLASAALVATLMACGGSSENTAPKQPTEATQPSSDESEPLTVCKQIYARQKECTDIYIPALVDLRIRLDVPQGIAQAAQEEGRDALIATAKQEWEADSAEPKVTETCEAMVQNWPAEKLQAMVDQGKTCMAQDGCQGFVDCAMPAVEEQLKASQQTGAGTP